MTQNSSRFGKQSKAQRVQVLGNDIARSTGGQYVLNATSGLLTLVAARTSTAGHVGAFRNASATNNVVINRIHCRFWVVTGFTTTQELGMSLIMARSYTASHSGGLANTITTNNGKKNTAHATLSDIDFRIGDTGALTAGTHTLDAAPFAEAGGHEMADSAAVPQARFELDYVPAPGCQLVLAQNEGIVLCNSILGGAAGVWRQTMMVEFELVDASDAFLQ